MVMTGLWGLHSVDENEDHISEGDITIDPCLNNKKLRHYSSVPRLIELNNIRHVSQPWLVPRTTAGAAPLFPRKPVGQILILRFRIVERVLTFIEGLQFLHNLTHHHN